MRVVGIIVAAGKGSRMGANTAKQYLPILSRPMISYTIDAFKKSSVTDIVLVSDLENIDYAAEIAGDDVSVISGGAERYDSVFKALEYIKESAGDEECVVLVHDGARPLITPEHINECIAMVRKCGACISAVPAKDTIKVVKDGVVVDTPDRRSLYQVQTPQCFDFKLLYDAYKKVLGDMTVGITDDAMVLETAFPDKEIVIVEGSYTNLKVTTPEDIIFAEALLQKA